MIKYLLNKYQERQARKQVLELTPDMIICPGERNIVRHAESRRAKDAYARSQVTAMRLCRQRMEATA